jgi:hypothetical protein
VYVELKEQRAAEKDAPQGERQTQTGFLGKKRPQRETETETEIQTQTQTQRGAGLQVERGGGGGGAAAAAGGMVCNDGDGAGERHTYSKSPEYSDWTSKYTSDLIWCIGYSKYTNALLVQNFYRGTLTNPHWANFLFFIFFFLFTVFFFLISIGGR